MKLFLEFAAVYNNIVTITDTTHAYQKLPPPTKSCYLKRHLGKEVDSSYVIPLGHAFQSHPEAGGLWEKMIDDILET